MNTIRDSVRQLLPPSYNNHACEVVEVNGILCDCQPIDNSAYITDVKLITEDKDGLLLVPKVGSIVIVSFNDIGFPYVSMYGEIDSIMIKGDNEGGLVKVNDLVTKLNNLENKVNMIITTFNTHTHVASSFGTPTTVPPVIITGNLTPTTANDLQNNKVKHGS